MGLRALDTPNGKGQPPNLYYDGWEPLALQLGQDIPRDEDRSESAERIRRKAYEAVRVRLKELADAGVITRLNVAGKGRRQTYRLNLGIGAPRAGNGPA